MGHPVIGPQSYWKLTPGEIRIYAEGLQAKQDRQEAEMESHDSPGDANYQMEHQQAKEQRDQEALQKVSQRAQA